jgi:hypothetical protein
MPCGSFRKPSSKPRLPDALSSASPKLRVFQRAAAARRPRSWRARPHVRCVWRPITFRVPDPGRKIARGPAACTTAQMHRAWKALCGNPAIERRPAERGDPYDVLKAEECGCGKRGGKCRPLRFGRDELHSRPRCVVPAVQGRAVTNAHSLRLASGERALGFAQNSANVRFKRAVILIAMRPSRSRRTGGTIR